MGHKRKTITQNTRRMARNLLRKRESRAAKSAAPPLLKGATQPLGQLQRMVGGGYTEEVKDSKNSVPSHPLLILNQYLIRNKPTLSSFPSSLVFFFSWVLLLCVIHQIQCCFCLHFSSFDEKEEEAVIIVAWGEGGGRPGQSVSEMAPIHT